MSGSAESFTISICRPVAGFTFSALGAAIAGHFHAAGLAAFSEIRFVQLVIRQGTAPLIREFELDRVSLKA